MYLTVHAAAGASIGTLFNSTPLAFGLAVLSHFVLDRIPHDDPPIVAGTARDGVLHNPIFRHFVIVALFDFIVALVLVTEVIRILPQYRPAAMVAGALGGVLPDLLFGLYRLTGVKWLAAYNHFHDSMHFDIKRFPITFFVGFTIQIISLTILLGLVLR